MKVDDKSSGGLAAAVSVVDCVLRCLARAASRTDLANVMEAITRELGFRHYALIHHDDLRGDPPGRVKLVDYPAAAMERIIGQGQWRNDPVMRGCSFAQRAFSWDELPSIIMMDRRDQECFAAGRRLGLKQGITIPYFALGEPVGSCTFAGAASRTSVRRCLGVAQMVGVFAFQAARRVIARPEQIAAPRPRLHPRPRDCIVLAGRGMSNKEIARELKITPRTVDGYLTDARGLFNVHGRTELVVSAILAGEVGLHELRPRQPE